MRNPCEFRILDENGIELNYKLLDKEACAIWNKPYNSNAKYFVSPTDKPNSWYDMLGNIITTHLTDNWRHLKIALWDAHIGVIELETQINQFRMIRETNVITYPYFQLCSLWEKKGYKLILY